MVAVTATAAATATTLAMATIGLLFDGLGC
jgi:hypothetical protein